MRINENLLEKIEYESVYVSYDETTGVAASQNNYQASRLQFRIPSTLKEGELYTFSFDLSTITGSNDITVSTYPDMSNTYIVSSNVKRQKISFKYNTDVKFVNIYMGIVGRATGSYRIQNLKLEEGEIATTYLPHKSSVKAENQAIFPIGGGTKKCILYNSKGGWVLWE